MQQNEIRESRIIGQIDSEENPIDRPPCERDFLYQLIPRLLSRFCADSKYALGKNRIFQTSVMLPRMVYRFTDKIRTNVESKSIEQHPVEESHFFLIVLLQNDVPYVVPYTV